MKIVIDIPEEFEEHFKKDRFEDSLSRVASDIESFGFQLAGRYEQETITMLKTALKNGTLLPKRHGRLIDEKVITDMTDKDLNWVFYDLEGLPEYIAGLPAVIPADKGE